MLDLDLSPIDFPTTILPIQDIPEHMARRVVRLDNNVPLGVVGPTYEIIKHTDAFRGAIESMEKGGVNFTDAKGKLNVYEHGALAKLEIDFPSHQAKIGGHDLHVKYVARNSYNGTWKFQSFFGWLNNVCFNTLVSGRKLAYTASRHTSGFSIETAHKKIENAINALNDDLPMYQKWWDTKIQDEGALTIFKKTLAKTQANDMDLMAGSPDTNQKQLKILMNLYHEETKQLHGKGDYGRAGASGSLWSVFQAATAWSTHLKDVTREESRKHIIQHKRQMAVRTMINSKHWKADVEVKEAKPERFPILTRWLNP